MRTFTVVFKIREELNLSDGVKTKVMRPYYYFSVFRTLRCYLGEKCRVQDDRERS